MEIRSPEDVDRIRFADDTGLVPLIAQDESTGEIRMFGYASREAVERTLGEGVVWFWSRSRGELWKKGETSGNVLELRSLHLDCDADALLARVSPAGPTCHTEAESCFETAPSLVELDRVIATRKGAPPEDSYTARLLADPNLRLKKLGEEAIELALACRSGEAPEIAEEAADLLYHTLVAARAEGVGLDDIVAVLQQRRRAKQPAR